MKRFLFLVFRVFLYIRKKVSSNYWQWYHVNYCLAKNVFFSDIKSIKINNRAIISISPSSKVSIGKAFYLNSGPESGIGTTPSKIIVAPGATLSVGDFTGISSTTILVKNSVVIGDYVNIGGGVL